MSALERQQQALLDALFAWPPENAMKKVATCVQNTGTRGLKTYQANGHALAERALQAAYPVLAQLVGDESFADLARALWHAHPPVCGDITQWGWTLIEFLRVSAQLHDEPYLADVAAAEWALHVCAGAANADADLSSLALLTHCEPEHLYFGLAPGCTVVHSRWPIASIMTAHTEQTPSFAEVGELLRAGVAQDALVWRCGMRPCMRLALPGEAAFVAALASGTPLTQALEAALEVDFGAWLPTAVSGGLLLSIQHRPISTSIATAIT